VSEFDVEGFKDGQRRMWSIGDYPDIATNLLGAADALVEQVGVQSGERLLDVATGSGNVALAAAGLGAEVTGLDLTPELLDAARRRSAEAGATVEWVEGDAEQLPFEDDTFDRVTSCFGVIFAPRHLVAVGELVRVARPGASIALTAWTPEGLMGKMFATVGSYMPPPPPGFVPPAMWGDEDYVRGLFSDSGAVLSFERRTLAFNHDSPESWVEHNARVLGPTILAKAALEPQGRWGELEAELIGLYQEANDADDGTLRAQAEYLLTVARLPT
jgi:SAM-dependent methyltransferase